MNKNDPYINGLDIQKEYLSIVQYSPRENSVVLVAIQPLVSGGVETIWKRTSSALQELKTRFKFSSPDFICALPSEYAIIKKIPVDDTVTQLDGLIEWELSQNVIGSIDEYVLDYQDGGVFRSGMQREVLAVAYRKDHLNEISTTLKTHKLKPVVVDIDVFAVVNTFEVNYKDRLSQPALIVHAESEKTKTILTQSGLYIDTDVFEYEYGAFDANTFAEKLQQQCNKIVEFNQMYCESVPSLYLTGSLFNQSDFTDAVTGTFGFGEVLNPFRTIGCKVGTDENQIMAYAAQLSVAVGLALRENK